ncbi:MAG: hypothetical protein KatS3mg110_3198 [Pirellulaceae bacterium]|nr:MAG: hypothetical protein KatS3mg110_3198 [Pirellulaceae bacterium]
MWQGPLRDRPEQYSQEFIQFLAERHEFLERAAMLAATARETGCANLRDFETALTQTQAGVAAWQPPALVVNITRQLQKQSHALCAELIRGHSLVLNKLEEARHDLAAQMASEDQFVIAVFGRVNSGKTSLANHMGGADYEATHTRGMFFVGNQEVTRLVEAPTATTNEYQGFRLPGILWVDCPGIGSVIEEHDQLARRLVARADIIVFVSSSDAPMTSSDLDEFARLVKSSGNEQFHGLIVVTKADQCTGTGFTLTGRKIAPRDKAALDAQFAWIKEQLRRAQLDAFAAIDPIPVSIYVARESLNLDWSTGTPRKSSKYLVKGAHYDQSGIPQLLRAIANIIDEHGTSLKSIWPEKRRNMLRSDVAPIIESARRSILETRSQLTDAHAAFRDALEKARATILAEVDAVVSAALAKKKELGNEELTEVMNIFHQKMQDVIRLSLADAVKDFLDHCGHTIHAQAQNMSLSLSRQRQCVVKRVRIDDDCDADDLLSFLVDSIVSFVSGLFGKSRKKKKRVKIKTMVTEGDAQYRERITREMKDKLDAMIASVEKEIVDNFWQPVMEQLQTIEDDYNRLTAVIG